MINYASAECLKQRQRWSWICGTERNNQNRKEIMMRGLVLNQLSPKVAIRASLHKFFHGCPHIIIVNPVQLCKSLNSQSSFVMLNPSCRIFLDLEHPFIPDYIPFFRSLNNTPCTSLFQGSWFLLNGSFPFLPVWPSFFILFLFF